MNNIFELFYDLLNSVWLMRSWQKRIKFLMTSETTSSEIEVSWFETATLTVRCWKRLTSDASSRNGI